MARNAAALGILRTFASTPLTTAPVAVSDNDALSPNALLGGGHDGGGHDVSLGGHQQHSRVSNLQLNPIPFHDLIADPWRVLAPYVVCGVQLGVQLGGWMGGWVCSWVGGGMHE